MSLFRNHFSQGGLLITFAILAYALAQPFFNPILVSAAAIGVSTASGSQHDAQIVSDGAGGSIIVWGDNRGSDTDVYAQRVDSFGNARWTSNGVVVTNATGHQIFPQLIADGSGGAIIVWEDTRNGNSDIYAQRINSSGVVQWTANGVAVSNASADQVTPQLTTDASGGAIITWADYRGGNADIYAQRISSSGVVQWTANGVAVSAATGNQSLPQIIAAGGAYVGYAVIAWEDNRSGSPDVYAQQINVSGTAQWTANGLAISTASNGQTSPRLVSDGGGGAYITWYDTRVSDDVYLQRVDAIGTIIFAANGINVNSGAGAQLSHHLIFTDSASVIIGWADDRGANNGNYDIYAQKYDYQGTPQWTANGILVATASSSKSLLSMAYDGSGGAILVWQDNRNSGTYNIYAQRINGSGVGQWTANGLALSSGNTTQQQAQAIARGTGAIVTWDQGNGTNDVYAEMISMFGTTGPTTINVGTSGTDQTGCGSATGASACRTVQYAIDAATSGDIISVGSGTYTENFNLGSKELILDGNNAATLSNTNDITSAKGVIDIVGGQTSYTVIRNFTFTGTAATRKHALSACCGAYPTFQGNTISGFTSHGIGSSGAIQPIVIRGNTIRDVGGYGIAISDSAALIDGNLIYDTDGNGSINIDVQKGSSATIVNNLLYTTGEGEGIRVDPDANSTLTAVIANNTFYRQGRGIELKDNLSSSGSLTAYIKNNIFESVPGINIDQQGGNTISVVSDYNIFHTTTSGESDVARVVGTGGSGVNYDTLSSWQAATDDDDNSFSGDPQLNAPQNSNFTLATTSLAIGTGTNNIVGANDLATYSLTQDYARNARPLSGTTVDIGAYESQAIGDLSSITVTANRSSLNTSAPTASLVATGNYTGGVMSTQTLTSVADWSSSNNTYLQISPGGVARGKSTGSANAVATYGRVSSSGFAISTSGLPDYISLYFDAANGNDTTNDGTQSNPYQTLSKLNTQALGMARHYLKGVFTGTPELTSADSGTALFNTWITNWPGQTATINANGGNSGINLNGADYITVQGLTIYGATDEVGSGAIQVLNGSDYTTVNNNTIYGSDIGIGEDTSLNSGTNHTYSNNRIYGNQTSGILVSNSSNDSIFNNVVYETSGSNVYEAGIGFMNTASDTAIWNNTLVNNEGGGLAVYDFGNGPPTATNLTFKNNLVVQTVSGYAAPVKVSDLPPTLSSDYNLLYTQNNIPLVRVGATNYSTLSAWQTATPYDDNSVNSDPLFTSLSTDDYTITSASPAGNEGVSAGAPTGVLTDIVGISRGTYYDIGAYEGVADPATGSRRQSDSATENSNGTASPAADSPASLQRSMSSFTHALALLRFMINLPSGRAASYLDFNNDGLFDTRDLRLFLNTRRGR